MHIYNPGIAADLQPGDAFFTGSLFHGSHVLEHAVVLSRPVSREGLVRFMDSSLGRRAILADEAVCIFDPRTAEGLARRRVPKPRHRQRNRAIMRYERRRVRDLREGDFVVRANTRGNGPFSYHFTVDSLVNVFDSYGRFLILESDQHEDMPLEDIVHVHRRGDDTDIPRG